MGSVFGAVSAFASLGMAIGPVAGGWVYDTTGAYTWLYIGSFVMGLSAMLVALTFPTRKLPSEPELRLQAAE
jgi:MFS family permease